MRIIGGQYKRRRLLPLPSGVVARPIPDQVREAVFNLLRGHFEHETVLDLFAGTGAFALEAVSRGAARAVCVEKDARMARTLEQNAEALGCADRVEVAGADALGAAALSRCPRGVHIVFVDPPYAMVRDPEQWERVRTQFERLLGLLDDTGYAILRTPWPFYHIVGEDGAEGARRDVDLAMGGGVGPETHRYGSTAVHLYMKDARGCIGS